MTKYLGKELTTNLVKILKIVGKCRETSGCSFIWCELMLNLGKIYSNVNLINTELNSTPMFLYQFYSNVLISIF